MSRTRYHNAPRHAHQPPAVIRKQLERRPRRFNRVRLAHMTDQDSPVELVPYRWAKGVGWFWDW